MRHRYECPLRWADMDQLRHINNVKYGDYLQEARVDFLRALELRVSEQDRAAEGEPFGIVVVRHEITYLAPLLFNPSVSVEIWVTEVRAASFTVGYEIFAEDDSGVRTVHVRASTRLTPFVFGAERPRRLTDRERAALAPYVEPDERPVAARARPTAVRRTALGHYPVAVRFSDLDPFGHVNNVIYLEYFQEGRVAFTGRLWRELATDAPRPAVVVAQADLDYLRPMVARPGGYDLWSWVRRIGDRSLVIDSEIHEPGTESVMARCSVVLVFVDGAGRSTQPPADYREPLERAAELADTATPGC